MPIGEEFHIHRVRMGRPTQGYGLGDVSFTVPSDHATITSYEARVRAQGSSTVIRTKDLGKPTPNASGVVTFNLRAILDALSAGNYTVSIAATNQSGTTDSSETSAFLVPLQLP